MEEHYTIKHRKLKVTKEHIKNVKYKHCCEALARYIEDPKVPIFYDKVMRSYDLQDIDNSCECKSNKSTAISCMTIDFCPRCCAKLSDLQDTWEKILLNEYGLDEPYHDDQFKKIPKEFHTDEWWKKRGL